MPCHRTLTCLSCIVLIVYTKPNKPVHLYQKYEAEPDGLIVCGLDILSASQIDSHACVGTMVPRRRHRVYMMKRSGVAAWVQ
jgi:hypothetical protein